MKEKKPYIDYKTARTFSWMQSFIMYAKHERDKTVNDLEEAIILLQIAQDKFKTASPDPNNWVKGMTQYGFIDNIARLRAASWEAGLNDTLFEKLKNVDFRDRFIGMKQPPVTKEELEEPDEGEVIEGEE